MLLAASAHADDSTFTGYARSLDTGELLYIESHAVSDAGSARRNARGALSLRRGFARPSRASSSSTSRSAPRPHSTSKMRAAASPKGSGAMPRGLTVFERAGAKAPLRAEPHRTPRRRSWPTRASMNSCASTGIRSSAAGARTCRSSCRACCDSVNFRVRKVGEVEHRRRSRERHPPLARRARSAGSCPIST